MSRTYDQAVSTRYHIYNSLFLNLPYTGIFRTGTLLPLLQLACEQGFEKGKDPKSIVKKFFSDFAPQATRDEQFDLLFSFIKYAERQVVLFDSVEDAAFEEVNDINGKGSLSALLLRTSSEGAIEELKKKIDDFSIRVVLTAHPTQFYPGTVLAIINDLEESIRERHLDHINLLLRQLGKTAFINKEKPSPFDEAVSLCWFLEFVFYHTIPDIILKLQNGLEMKPEEWKNYDLIKVGFWPGGDRDGNPFVTHDITKRVAQRLQQTLLKCYYRDIRHLKRRLTFKGVEEFIGRAENKIYPLAFGSTEEEEGYQNADELLADLLKARKVLVDDHRGLFLDLLDAFILKVRIFGFYFASMDIRQDSRKHAYAWEAIFKQLQSKNKNVKDFDKLTEAEQIDTLLKLKFKPQSLKFDDNFVTELIESISVIETIQKSNGIQGCQRYVISNCQSAVDVIKVYQLANLILGKGSNNISLDIVPLFETIEDLANAQGVMEALYNVPAYREHVKSRGDKQSIMLGFSDGTKDGGYLRANWSIFRAKENLTMLSRQYGVTAVFFDGRGGPPARGGGNTHDFYASLGDTIEDKEVQVTVQGQTISSNFGKPASCLFNLEQLLSAGVENAVFGNKNNQFAEKEKSLMEALAVEGHKAYLELKHDPKFVPYLEKITPLAFFGDTNIGSRPVKRSQSDSLKFEDLRAIPFVGSWAQMKQNIPGFYGVGSAIMAMKKAGKMKELKALYKNSLFVRTLLGNSMMSLTKSYYPATAYLAKDKEFGAFWKKMHNEYKLSTAMILEVSGLSELMENNPVNRDSVKLRERIVLPLITIQQYALQNLRALDGNEKQFEKQYRKLAMRCMFGIINAARNSA